MPHVIVKLWPGKSEKLKKRLADAITRDVMEILDYGEESVSVALEEIPAAEWAEKVYRPDIVQSAAKLYKKPDYTMWPVPVSPDTNLSFSSRVLELHRTHVADRRVSTNRIVEPLDVIEHVRLPLIPRVVLLSVHALRLQAREETLHCRVVPDVPLPAHRAGNAVIGEQALELLALVLASLVGVVQQLLRRPTPPQRHQQSIGHELRRHARAHRPPDDPAREQIKHHSHVEPALVRPDAREVRNPALVRRVCFELSVEQIARDGVLGSHSGI
jgi:4-oxalocrotonate tautomerase